MATSRGPHRRVSNDTIVAVATPLGHAGLGVVRLSGPDALRITSQLFDPATKKFTSAVSHTLHTGWIKHKSARIDQAVAAVFRAPNSYTGEDVVEISCHGSPALLNDVVRLSVEKGARIARPGEFTERAYLNGKMDLAQAEAVAELIHAGGKAARSMAAEQLHGRLSSRIGEIRQALIRFLAHLEANLDFVEEDIPGFSRAAMQRELKTINGRVNELLVTSLRGRLLRDGVRVAIVGRPNVGKSSLFNALLASERAIVTNVPGTTRDVLEEKIEWDGVSIVLFDTAGLRSTKNAVEKEGTRRARRASAQADVVLYVLDASRSIPINDRHALKELSGKTVILVMNKSDKPNRIKNVSSFEPYATIKTSAIKRTGLSSLRKAVVSAVAAHAGPARHETGVVVTNQRHVEALEKAQKLLDEAIRAIASGRSEEALSVFVRQALEAIGTITGEAVTEDVLSAIFARFCVGK